jgi:hypothetical protein
MSMVATVWHIYDRDVPALRQKAMGRILVFDVEGLCGGVVDEKLPTFQFYSGAKQNQGGLSHVNPPADGNSRYGRD